MGAPVLTTSLSALMLVMRSILARAIGAVRVSPSCDVNSLRKLACVGLVPQNNARANTTMRLEKQIFFAVLKLMGIMSFGANLMFFGGGLLG